MIAYEGPTGLTVTYLPDEPGEEVSIDSGAEQERLPLSLEGWADLRRAAFTLGDNPAATAVAASAEAVISALQESCRAAEERAERAEKALARSVPGDWFIVARSDLRMVLESYAAATLSAEARGAAERLARVAWPLRAAEPAGEAVTGA